MCIRLLPSFITDNEFDNICVKSNQMSPLLQMCFLDAPKWGVQKREKVVKIEKHSKFDTPYLVKKTDKKEAIKFAKEKALRSGQSKPIGGDDRSQANLFAEVSVLCEVLQLQLFRNAERNNFFSMLFCHSVTISSSLGFVDRHPPFTSNDSCRVNITIIQRPDHIRSSNPAGCTVSGWDAHLSTDLVRSHP